MVDDLRIAVLVENAAPGPDLPAEHGWALWIEADGRRILFDTEQGIARQELRKWYDGPPRPSIVNQCRRPRRAIVQNLGFQPVAV